MNPAAGSGVLEGMTIRRRLLCTLSATLLLAAAVAAQVPPDATILPILTERVGKAEGVGIVVGIVGPGGRRIVAVGPHGGDTAFEIGSVTKVFTALLLADMARRGEVSLDDPVAKYLPGIPERNGRAIRLVDLATHTSGLPFMPDGPVRTTHDIGAGWEYSNLGYKLLGDALAARAGVSYEELLRRRITAPLKMRNTAIGRSRARLAPGHDASLQPAPGVMSVPLYADLAAAGGIVSTANDLLTFLVAERDLSERMMRTRRPKSAGVEQALGWLVEDGLLFHDGGTFGYASAVAWDPRQRVGVVVLMNQVGDVADIARHLLRPNVPLTKPAPVVTHQAIVLDAELLDRYAGRYEVEGEGAFIVTRVGDALTFEAPPDWGLPLLRLHPESRTDFFANELPLRVTFQDGAMLIHPPRGQKVLRARSSRGSSAP